MQATVSEMSKAFQYNPQFSWQEAVAPNRTIIPTSSYPPRANHQTESMTAKVCIGYTCEVAQNVAIVEIQRPTGTAFIPIQNDLSQLCAKFHHRKVYDNEYTLGDIYLAMKTYLGAKQGISHLECRLRARLLDTNFACSEQGQFEQLLLFLHQPITIRREGAQIVEFGGPGQLEEATFDSLFPYDDRTGRTGPRCYWMSVALHAFGGYRIWTLGTVAQFLRILDLK